MGPAPLFDNGTSLWCESPNTEIGNALSAMPFMDTQKKQLGLVKQHCIDEENIDMCVTIVHDVLSGSPYLDKERVQRISEAVGKRVRGLKSYLTSI